MPHARPRNAALAQLSLATAFGCRSMARALLIAAPCLLAAAPLHAAISWDGEGESQWWFDPVNWSRDQDTGGPFLPPSQGVPPTATDTQINGVGPAPQTVGASVLFDPASDPFFPLAAGRPFADGFGPQIINQLYISRNTVNHNTLTINGDLEARSNVIIGRSGSTAEAQNLGMVIQTGGTVRVPTNTLDLGQREASGWGNGTYDYRGGILEVQQLGGSQGIRLSAGSATNGTGGKGRFIMHNPTTPGYVRTFDFTMASDGNSGDGVTTGVATVPASGSVQVMSPT